MNTIEFHKTTAKELLAIKDRVRHLIDHWGEDGRYKEAVLKSVIERFLPEKYRIGSGFVVRQTRQRGNHDASNQIDIIIYDTKFPVLFKEGDFVIVTPDSVKAIIEVKANLKNQGIKKVIDKSNKIGRFIFEGRTNRNTPIFNGIFSYTGYNRITQTSTLKLPVENSWNELEDVRNREKFSVNHIAFNQDRFYKFWNHLFEEDNPPHYLYNIKGLCFSFFISNLIDHLSENSVIENSNLWYPVDKSIVVTDRF